MFLFSQGTSVLSPVLHIGSVIMLAMMIYKKSAVQLFERHPCLYILAFGFVAAKITNKLVVS
jgi:choline/ethanolamine phosphotransferase